MNLHDQLERDLRSHLPYDDAVLDVDRLGRVARSQGTRALRRRRAATAVAGLAAATVVGVSALSYGADTGTGTDGLPVAGSEGSPRSSTIRVDFDPARPGPAGPTTGRGLAAALWWALADLQDGTATTFGGQVGHEWHASLEWSSVDGLGVSQIDINIQNDMSSAPDRTCAPDGVIDCQVTTLPDGTLLKSYEQHTTDGVDTGIRRQVQLVRPDGVRIGVSATNGYDGSGGVWDVTRAQPPLTVAQLSELAEQPFWDATLPTTFLDAGRDLAPYDPQGTRWPETSDGS